MFGNSVQVQNLRVTPKLEIIASKVEISHDDKHANNLMNGLARGVSFAWEIRDDFVPEIPVSTGPLLVPSMGEVDSGTLLLAIDLWAIKKIAFKGNLRDLKIDRSAGVEQIDLSGVFSQKDFELQKLKVSTTEIYSLIDQEFSISPLTAFAETVKFEKITLLKLLTTLN